MCLSTDRGSGPFKVHALEDVDSHVDPGDFVCVVGRSGHGKTTLLRVLAGLQPPIEQRLWTLRVRGGGGQTKT